MTVNQRVFCDFLNVGTTERTITGDRYAGVMADRYSVLLTMVCGRGVNEMIQRMQYSQMECSCRSAVRSQQEWSVLAAEE